MSGAAETAGAPALVERIDAEGRPFMGLPDVPADGTVIEVRPRGVEAEPEAPGLGTGSGGGVGAGEGQGAPAAEAEPAPPMPPMPPEPPDPGRYEDRLAERQAEAAVARARARAEARERRRQQREVPAQVEPPPTPEERSRAAEVYAQAQVARLGLSDATAPAGEGEPAAPAAPAARPGRGTPAAQAAAREVVRSAAEVVTGIPRGVAGAFASAFEAGDDLADWLNRQVPLSSVAPGDPNTPGRTIGRAIRMLQPGREPETLAGKVTEELTQFLTGFLRGQVVLRQRGILQGGGAGRQVARAAAAGAIADFFFNEADEGNLADAWTRAGLPGAALTQFLATDPNDDAAANRLRNMLVGLGVGAAVDGALGFARAARAGAAARRQAEAAGAPVAAPEAVTLPEAAGMPARPERDLLIVGDPARPLVEFLPREAGDAGARMAEAAGATSDAALGVPSDVAARGLAGAARDAAGMGPAAHLAPVENTAAIRTATDPGPVFINWGLIQTSDDVKAVLRAMADGFRGRINEAGRGVQTHAETVRLADMLGLTPEQLLSRNRGEVLNAETTYAARRLYTASGERLLAAAEAAAAPGAGALEQAAFRRMMAIHYAIQAQILGARREAARAFNAWAIPAASGGRQMRMIEDLLEASGGVDVSRAMAEQLVALGKSVPAERLAPELGKFARHGVWGRTAAVTQQVWVNGLLSNPATHLANIAGNFLNIPLSIIERGAQAGVGRLTASADAVEPGEVAAMTYGLLTGFRDALRLMVRTYQDDGVEIARMIGRQDLPRQGAISSQAFQLDAGSGLGKVVDWVGHSVISAPGRAMGAQDAFFKVLIYRMELHAYALRQAVREAPRRADGTADPDAVGAIMARITSDPPEAVQRAAAEEALYRTFNRELKRGTWARSLQDMRATDQPGMNLATSIVLPFVRTPINLFKYGLERTPLAPLVADARADIAAGGARRDGALARIAVGSMILAHTYQLAEQGFVTGYGPMNPAERQAWLRTGAQPYSVRIGDTWVPFNRLDPYGFILGFAADTRELMDRRDLGEREEIEMQRMIAGSVAMLSNALGERSVFRGVASLAEAIDRRQPNAENFVGQAVGSLIVPGIVNATSQALDPTMYDRGQGWIAGRLSGFGADAGIPRRNLWGEEMTRMGVDVLGPVGAAVSPIKPTRQGGRPVDAEMRRLGMGLLPPDANGTVVFGQAPVNVRNIDPAALDQFRRWAGNELPLPAFGGKGLADALDEMVQGRGPYGAAYARASDEGKERAIKQAAMVFRRAAREALLDDPRFSALADVVQQRRAAAGEGRGEVPIPGSLGAAQRAPGEAVAPRRRTAPEIR